MENEVQLLDKAASRPFSDGWVWIKKAFGLSQERAGKWLLMSVIMCLCIGLCGFFLYDVSINILREFIAIFLLLSFTGGLVVSMASLIEEDDLATSYLFAGFQYKFLQLLFLSIGLILISGILNGLGYMILMAVGINIMTLAVIVPIVFFISFSISWLALPLIMLQDIKPLTAIKMSFSGSLKNILPILCAFLVFLLAVGGFVMLIIALKDILSDRTLSKIRFLVLVLLLTVPIINAAFMYVGYRNIWTNEPME
ncbi:hypothetical protein [Wielerella bovis]|uniref:hypothetical protein n=1 Tax=Wielerella bovis TaxID=2917790 RepID=UPI002018E403|nr:hypothetical protein [Wielerella bovis]ULJ66365.1 hypothetical protein MIS31_08850 [Wielerella bovis]